MKMYQCFRKISFLTTIGSLFGILLFTVSTFTFATPHVVTVMLENTPSCFVHIPSPVYSISLTSNLIVHKVPCP